LNEYVTSRQLLNARDQSYVNLSADKVLSETLSSHGKNKNGPQEIEFIKRDELSKRLLEKMQAWYEIRGEGKDTVVK
jgi:translation initiation factor 2D